MNFVVNYGCIFYSEWKSVFGVTIEIIYSPVISYDLHKPNIKNLIVPHEIYASIDILFHGNHIRSIKCR